MTPKLSLFAQRYSNPTNPCTSIARHTKTLAIALFLGLAALPAASQEVLMTHYFDHTNKDLIEDSTTGPGIPLSL